MEIRNIAIIAHVDHGKTTLTDALMRQTGVLKEGASMDSNALELERGITIYSKNAAIFYKDTKINIVDTPGHADFGSEVERVLRSIDSVLLVIDAQEGPMPQTRFVLKKSLELGLKPIVVINKIDKPAANPAGCEERTLELFLELGADDEQADFPVVYSIGRSGIAKRRLADESGDLTPLLDAILKSGGAMLITADHGNVERKRNPISGEKLTEHSINPVPLYLVGEKFRLAEPVTEEKIIKRKKEVRGVLTDVAPTLLELLDLTKPEEMNGQGLLSILIKS